MKVVYTLSNLAKRPKDATLSHILTFIENLLISLWGIV